MSRRSQHRFSFLQIAVEDLVYYMLDGLVPLPCKRSAAKMVAKDGFGCFLLDSEELSPSAIRRGGGDKYLVVLPLTQCVADDDICLWATDLGALCIHSPPMLSKPKPHTSAAEGALTLTTTRKHVARIGGGRGAEISVRSLLSPPSPIQGTAIVSVFALFPR